MAADQLRRRQRVRAASGLDPRRFDADVHAQQIDMAMPARQPLLEPRGQCAFIGFMARAEFVELAQAGRVQRLHRRDPELVCQRVGGGDARREQGPRLLARAGRAQRKPGDALADITQLVTQAQRVQAVPGGSVLQRRARGRGHLLCLRLQLRVRFAVQQAEALQQALGQRCREQRQLGPAEQHEGQRQRQRVGQHTPCFAEPLALWSHPGCAAAAVAAIVAVGSSLPTHRSQPIAANPPNP